MDVTENSSTGSSVRSGGSDEPPIIEPLTRSEYVRLPNVERQISEAVTLDGPTLMVRARQRDEADPISWRPKR